MHQSPACASISNPDHASFHYLSHVCPVDSFRWNHRQPYIPGMYSIPQMFGSLKITTKYHEIVVKPLIKHEICGFRILKHFASVCVNVYLSMYLCIYVCMHACMHVYIYIYIITFPHFWWLKSPTHTMLRFPATPSGWIGCFRKGSHLGAKARDMDAKLPVGDLVPPDLKLLVWRVFHLVIENQTNKMGKMTTTEQRRTHEAAPCICSMYIHIECILIYICI